MNEIDEALHFQDINLEADIEAEVAKFISANRPGPLEHDRHVVHVQYGLKWAVEHAEPWNTDWYDPNWCLQGWFWIGRGLADDNLDQVWSDLIEAGVESVRIASLMNFAIQFQRETGTDYDLVTK